MHVNYTMDMQCDWQKRFEVSNLDLDLNETNIVAHSDGGTRAEKCSAASWFVEAVTFRGGSEKRFPVLMGGTFMSTPISSFLAEALGLEAAIKAVRSIVLTP